MISKFPMTPFPTGGDRTLPKDRKTGETDHQHEEYPVHHERGIRWTGGIDQETIEWEGIGFGAEIRSKDERAEYLKQVKAEDLIAYGFESEFIGRLPVTAIFEKLEVDDLYGILKNPNNPIVLGKKKDFKSYGIDIQFDDEALYDLAIMACGREAGARGLVSAVEKVLLKFEKRLPSTYIQKLVVTKAVVENAARKWNGFFRILPIRK